MDAQQQHQHHQHHQHQHQQHVHVFLRLPHPFVQIEQRMTPACAGEAAFVIYVAGGPGDAEERLPLAISPAARKMGLEADAPLRALRESAGNGRVRFIPAAGWAASGDGSGAMGEREAIVAYVRVVEQGPWALVRKVVEGEGMELASGDGVGERYVRVTSGLERAQELARYLQAEVERILGYELRVGVAIELEDARREARGLLLLPRARGTMGNAQVPPSSAARPTTATTSTPVPPPSMDVDAPGTGDGDIDVADIRMCPVCWASFFEPAALVAHMEERHGGPAQWQQVDAREAEVHGGLEGPGLVAFTEVLGALTDPAAIEAFLAEAEQARREGAGSFSSLS